MSPVLVLHIVGGSIGLLSGAAALAVRKGGRLHKTFGLTFMASMVTMCAMAALLEATLPDWGNMPGSMFTFYLVVTGWTTVQRKTPGVGVFDYGALLFTGITAGVCALLALKAMGSPTGKVDGTAAPNFIVFAGLAIFAAGMDLKVILQAGVSGRPRIARHIWRVCTALFFATGSFFLGQQQVMPAFVQGSPLLIVLALAPLPLMLFWLVRARQRNVLFSHSGQMSGRSVETLSG